MRAAKHSTLPALSLNQLADASGQTLDDVFGEMSNEKVAGVTSTEGYLALHKTMLKNDKPMNAPRIYVRARMCSLEITHSIAKSILKVRASASRMGGGRLCELCGFMRSSPSTACRS